MLLGNPIFLPNQLVILLSQFLDFCVFSLSVLLILGLCFGAAFFPFPLAFVAVPPHFVRTFLKLCSDPFGSSIALLAVVYGFASSQKFEGLGFGNEQVSLEIPVLYPARQCVFFYTTRRLDRPYTFLMRLW